MFSESVRRQLEQLHRAAAAVTCLTPSTREEGASFEAPTAAAPADRPLAGQQVETPFGAHWLIRRRLDQLWPQGRDQWQSGISPQASTGESAGDGVFRPFEIAAFRRCFPSATVFLDLETCGLAGSPIFLAGVLHFDGDDFVLAQIWARDYSEEKALLHSLWSFVHGQQVLVTFNGKSFDWPQVHDRSTLHRLGQRAGQATRRNDEMPVADGKAAPLHAAPCYLTPRTERPEPHHFDLLHHARRRWKRNLPNCRLQTLERYICGRHRVGDIEGRDIPAAYHDYVRTARLDQVRDILHHNALDLVTLLQLALTFRG